MEPTAIRVQSATRCFGALTAVDDLSFEVQTGEVFGLLGPNGAGKTTAINLITGMLRRDGGEIQVLGWDPQMEARQVRQRIGYVPQETNVYLDLSAVDNLWHHAALYCQELGYEYEIVKTEKGERGYCILPNGDRCDAWD